MPQLDMIVKKLNTEDAPYTCLSLNGFIDPSTVSMLETKLKDLENNDSMDLVIDCQNLKYISSSGMGILMSLYGGYASRGREVVLTSVTPEVKHLIDLIGISSVVPLFETQEAAAGYLQSGPAGQRLHPDMGPRPKPASTRKQRKITASPKVDSAILIISPWKNEFNDIMKKRLGPAVSHFEILGSCKTALEILDSMNPDLVILEDKTPGSEGFVFTMKTEKRRSVIPLIRIFAKEDESRVYGPFKIWENDYLIEPFDITELFTISEWTIKQSPHKRRGILHQTHFTFNSTRESANKANQLGKSIIDQLGLDPVAASGIKAGFAEAIDNAVRHGNREAEDKYVDVRFLATREKIVIRIEDQGEGFDHNFYQERMARGPEAYKREVRKSGRRGGLGLLVIRLCADELKFEGRGNIIQIVKTF